MTGFGGGDGHLRVAIVGLGPKGLFALERLLHHMHGPGRWASLEVELFEPHPVPGAGPVYDPGQPAYLRLNFSAEQLNLWGHGSLAVPSQERLSFQAWRRELAPDEPAEDLFPARALVGRYLADGLARMLHHAPERMRITLRPAAVDAIRRSGAAWELSAGDATYVYDEILVAVGHRRANESSASSWEHSAPLVPAVFPVSQWLTQDKVVPDAVVAVRGFALTFIDAALALTEGRGGVFESRQHPFRLRFVPSADCVGSILPFSRTGRPILAKPDPGLADGIPALESIAETGRRKVEVLGRPLLNTALIDILASTAAANLKAANGGVSGGVKSRQESAASDWLRGALEGRPLCTGLDPAVEVERSLEVAVGLRAPDLHWALGHTWRSLYPALVGRLGGRGLAAHEWPSFHQLAAEMERVAFGPPPINAAKLLALVESQVVDLAYVRKAGLVTNDHITSIRTDRDERRVDVVVDAVLSGPGAMGPADGLVERLVAAGYARVLSGRRGVEIGSDAACIGRDGHRTAGLSAIGRATEDSVIGNDTLSRTLHPHADRWAQRIFRRTLRRKVHTRRLVAPRETT